MKKYFWGILSIMMIAVLSVSFVSCGDDEEETNGTSNGNTNSHGGGSSNQYSEDDEKEEIYQRIATYGGMPKELIDTQWQLEKSVHQYPSYKPFYGKRETSYDYNGILTFSKEIYDVNEISYIPHFKLYLNGVYVGTWHIYWWEKTGNNNDGLLLDWDTGNTDLDEEYENAYGCVAHIASILQNGALSLKNKGIDDSYRQWTYRLVKRGDFNKKMNQNSGDNSGDGESVSEAPRIGFYDFSATKSSLTVKYQIYNKEEANISSARVYYGTSSNPTKSVSASVSGVYITATITGLSAGTEYYIQCKATGSGGSTTTDVVKCITNY